MLLFRNLTQTGLTKLKLNIEKLVLLPRLIKTNAIGVVREGLHFSNFLQLFFTICSPAKRHSWSLDGVHSTIFFAANTKHVAERSRADVGLDFKTLAKERVFLWQIVMWATNQRRIRFWLERDCVSFLGARATIIGRNNRRRCWWCPFFMAR